MEGITVVLPPFEEVQKTFGPYLTGIMIQQLLMGVVVLQAYDYYRGFPTDTMFNKILVGFLTLVSILQAVMDYLSLYRSTVVHFGQFLKFDCHDWTLWWEIGVTALIGAMCQGFFLERCWAATKSYVFLAIGGTVILGSLAAGIASTFTFVHVQKLSAISENKIPMTLWLVSSAVLNISIAAMLIWTLGRVKLHFCRTEAIITRIIRLAFTTSSLTAAIAILNVALYLGIPDAAWHLLPQLVMGKIYAISVLATLASRTELRNIIDNSSVRNATNQAGSVRLYAEAPVGTPTSYLFPRKSVKADFISMPPKVDGIRISTIQVYHRDDDSIAETEMKVDFGGSPQETPTALSNHRTFDPEYYGGYDGHTKNVEDSEKERKRNNRNSIGRLSLKMMPISLMGRREIDIEADIDVDVDEEGVAHVEYGRALAAGQVDGNSTTRSLPASPFVTDRSRPFAPHPDDIVTSGVIHPPKVIVTTPAGVRKSRPSTRGSSM